MSCGGCNSCATCATSNGRNAWPGLGNLAGSLVATVDEARQLESDFGLRPYRVFATTIRWTGGEIGRGVEQITSSLEFTPTPKIKNLDGVRGVVKPGGLVERGQTMLEQISARYTEDQIKQALPARTRDTEAFIEVVNAHDGNRPERRRFTVAGVPVYDAGGYQWRVTLLRQDSDRERNGSPNGGR